MKKNSQKAMTTEPLVEGIDYYIENNYWIFTAHYHQKRTYCCQNGCRHCPYGFKKKF